MPLHTCNPHITEQDVHCQSSVVNCGLAGKTMMGSLCHCSTCPLPATSRRTEDNGEKESDDVCARMRAAIEENLTIVNSDVLSCRVASLRRSNSPNPAEKYTSSSAATSTANNGPCLSRSHPPCNDPKMTAFQSSKSLVRLKPFVAVRSRFSRLRWWMIALSLLLVALAMSPTAEARSLPRRSGDLSTNPSSNSTSSNAPAPDHPHQHHPAQEEGRGLVNESKEVIEDVTIRQPNKRSAKKVTRLGKRKGGKNGSKKTHKKGKKGKKHRKNRKGKKGKGGKRKKCNRKNKKKGKKGKKCRTNHDPRTTTTRQVETTTPQPETTTAGRSSSKMSAGSSQNSPRTERLYNKQGTAFHLAVTTNGRVFGEEAKIRSNFSLIDVRSMEKGFVTLKGTVAELYICVTDKGRVVGRKKFIKAFCQFREGIELNKQNTYQSLFPCGNNSTCSGFLNISKNGRVRPVINVERESQYAHFLPRLRSHNSKRKRRQTGKRRNFFTLTPADGSESGRTEFLLTVTEPGYTTEERVLTTTISNDE